MKAGVSTLNPYAESYVPLSKREGINGKNDFKSPGVEAKRANEATVLGPQNWDPMIRAPQTYNTYGGDAFYTAENSKLKGHADIGFHGSSSYNPADVTEKEILDEEFDMDLAYLQMTFPGISEESLSGVYLANRGDLDATIDMLNHLEAVALTNIYIQKDVPKVNVEYIPQLSGNNVGAACCMTIAQLYPVDSSQKLPDTLDIGDVPESGNASEIASQKLKNVSREAGASSSGLSGTTPAV